MIFKTLSKGLVSSLIPFAVTRYEENRTINLRPSTPILAYSSLKEKAYSRWPLKEKLNLAQQEVKTTELFIRLNNIPGKDTLTDADVEDQFQVAYTKSKAYATLKNLDWTSLKKMAETQAQDMEKKECKLPSGRVISYEAFAKMPEFAGTLEKHTVHQNLSLLLTQKPFLRECKNFQKAIQKEDWYKRYETRPKLLQYLALAAFLEKTITVEELAVICMVAVVSKNNTNENKITVLNKDSVIPYLEEHFFTKDCSFIEDIHYQDQFSSSKCSSSWVQKFAAKSPIERTAILYQTSNETRYTFPGDKNLLANGSLQEKCILSLPVILDLLEALFKESHSITPPSKHTLQFGYRKSLQEILQGRPVAMVGIFTSPPVHGQLGGLETVSHDINHLTIDWSHPYTKVIIDLADKILKKDMPIYKNFAHSLLERVFIIEGIQREDSFDFAVGFWMFFLTNHAFKIFRHTTNGTQNHELCLILKELPKELISKDVLEKVDKKTRSPLIRELLTIIDS